MREKLIELIKQFYMNNFIHSYQRLADHLIANGVIISKMETVATDNNKWIPVTERLPEKDVLVLCIGSKGGMFLGYPKWVYEDEKVAYTYVPNSRHGRQAKYWMPLPEPPKGEEE